MKNGSFKNKNHPTRTQDSHKLGAKTVLIGVPGQLYLEARKAYGFGPGEARTRDQKAGGRVAADQRAGGQEA